MRVLSLLLIIPALLTASPAFASEEEVDEPGQWTLWATGGLQLPFTASVAAKVDGNPVGTADSRKDGGLSYGLGFEYFPPTGPGAWELVIERVPLSDDDSMINFLLSPKLKARDGQVHAWIGPAVGFGLYRLTGAAADRVTSAFSDQGISPVAFDQQKTFFATQLRAGVDVDIGSSLAAGFHVTCQPFRVTLEGDAAGTPFESRALGFAFQWAGRVGVRF